MVSLAAASQALVRMFIGAVAWPCLFCAVSCSVSCVIFSGASLRCFFRAVMYEVLCSGCLRFFTLYVALCVCVGSSVCLSACSCVWISISVTKASWSESSVSAVPVMGSNDFLSSIAAWFASM